MATAYNGWSAAPGWSIKGGQLEALVVAGEAFAPGVRAGDVATVLRYVATQLHQRVEPVIAAGFHDADDWGYNYRQNRNANNLSVHSAGAAIDYNATRHPNGKGGTFSAGQVAEIRRILAEVNGVVRWGGDFPKKDEMHFEIVGSAAAVAAAARKVAGAPSVVGTVPVAPPAPPAPNVEKCDPNWQRKLAVLGYDVGIADGIRGDKTKAATRAFEQAAGIPVDAGIEGPQCWGAANKVPNYPGDKGYRAFQQRLKDRGWKITVDNDWGPKSKAILAAFQKEKGLGADGIPGPMSWTALWTRGL